MSGHFSPDTLLRDAAREDARADDMAVAAVVDGAVRDLDEPVGKYRGIEWIYITSEAGGRIYRRSVVFLLLTALGEMYGQENAELTVRASVSGGLYCDISLPEKFDGGLLKKIENHMRKIVSEDRPIVRKTMPREEAARLFKKVRLIPKANIFNAMSDEIVNVYYCGEVYNYFYGAMVDRTGGLGKFAIETAGDGLIVRTPMGGREIPKAIWQPRFANILRESRKWARILDCEYLPDLNRIVKDGRAGEIVRISEALHEKKIASIADMITENIKKSRVILIAGPSSSGKTSFAQRLKVQLRVNGLRPVSISLDNYFKNRSETPLTPEGAYDFESLDALDVPVFNRDLIALIEGREATVPRYDFITGTRTTEGCLPMSIAPDQPIILEGIHGLNEKLTPSVPREMKFKIYISALTQLSIDSHNRIATTDARLVRRLVRDYQFRGSAALKTLRQWSDVRKGEEKNIFPFQEEADVFFNSALIYELAVLKKYATPLLGGVTPDMPEYIKARSLLGLVSHFCDIYNEDDIPNNSILREFIGKSCFFTSSGECKE